MKYIVILVIVILFVRIDYLLGLFDRANEKLSNAPSGNVVVDDSIANREVIPVKQDRTLQRSKKDTFLALLEDFQVSPVADIHNRAMTILKDNPQMFGTKLDKDLENHIFRWRDLLNNNDQDAVNFLLDLMNVLQGENLDMVKRFFALWMEINMEHFIAAYSRTKDTNCTIVTTFGDRIPEEEKLNEYYDREEALKTFLAKDRIDPAQKALATNCVLQLGIIIDKLAPKPDPNAVRTPETDPASAEQGTSP